MHFWKFDRKSWVPIHEIYQKFRILKILAYLLFEIGKSSDQDKSLIWNTNFWLFASQKVNKLKVIFADNIREDRPPIYFKFFRKIKIFQKFLSMANFVINLKKVHKWNDLVMVWQFCNFSKNFRKFWHFKKIQLKWLKIECLKHNFMYK